MFTETFRNGSPNQLRDIDIAIEYRSGTNLRKVGEKYGLNQERIRQIHAVQLRNVLKQIGKWREFGYLRRNFNPNDLGYLKAYREFLINKKPSLSPYVNYSRFDILCAVPINPEFEINTKES